MFLRLLTYRAGRRVLDEPSGAGALLRGFAFGFLVVVCGLIVLGALIDALT